MEERKKNIEMVEVAAVVLDGVAEVDEWNGRYGRKVYKGMGAVWAGVFYLNVGLGEPGKVLAG